jgi:hypothetical protein
MRDMAGKTAASAAKCKNVRRGSFIRPLLRNTLAAAAAD